MQQSHRFGYEWKRYPSLFPHYEEQFLRWINPLTKADFQGKDILDAGCGMGRNMIWPLSYGARSVVGFDLDARSVSSARDNLKEFPNATVEQGNIYTYLTNKRFDVVFSIGVIHHLADPLAALKNLVRFLKPEGILLIWVYGLEGNEWIVKYGNPIRNYITSKLPLGLLHTVSYAVSIPFYLYLKIVPQRGVYLRLLKSFPFPHIHTIVFDQLIPEIAYYWSRDEALALLSRIHELSNIRISHTNNMSWTVMGTRR